MNEEDMQGIESLLDVLGDGLSALRDGVSGELTGEDELHGRLDLSGGEGPPLVEADQLGALSGDAVEGVVDEGVHDVHGLLGDSDIRVNLLEHLVDVDGEGLNSSPASLLVSSSALSFRFLSHIDNRFAI